jgi:hypothetical protein
MESIFKTAKYKSLPENSFELSNRQFFYIKKINTIQYFKKLLLKSTNKTKHFKW